MAGQWDAEPVVTCSAPGCGNRTRSPDAQGRCVICRTGGAVASDPKPERAQEQAQRCLTCHEMLPLAAFEPDLSLRSGYVHICKECRAAKVNALTRTRAATAFGNGGTY